MARRLIPLFIFTSLFSAFAGAATSSGLWIFINLNNQSEEIRVAKQLAGAGNLLVLNSTDEFVHWSSAHPEVHPKTLIISGHASGDGFLDGASFDLFSAPGVVQKNPQLGQIENLYLLGCYTGKTGYAREWKKILPGLKFYFGFEDEAPTGKDSSSVFEKIERARQNLNENTDLATAARIFSGKFETSEHDATNGILVYFRANDTLRLDAEGHAEVANFQKLDSSICNQSAKKLLDTINSSAPDGIAYTHNPEVRKSVVFDFLAAHNIVGEASYLVPPKDATDSVFRKMDDETHTLLADCGDSFYSDSIEARELGFLNHGEAKDFKDHLTELIHAPQATQNFGICGDDFLQALARRSSRCETSNPLHVDFERALSHRPLQAGDINTVIHILAQDDFGKSIYKVKDTPAFLSPLIRFLENVATAGSYAGGSVLSDAWTSEVHETTDLICQKLHLSFLAQELDQKDCGYEWSDNFSDTFVW